MIKILPKEKISKEEIRLCFIVFSVTVFVITSMVLLSEILGEREIIFPEIAAICVGAFLAPDLAWKTSYVRMVICVTLCAICGVLIVLFCHVPLWLELIIAYVAGQIIFLYSGTSFAPMISAIVLPVLLQTESIVYLLSALSLTSTIVLIRLILEKTGVLSKNQNEKVAFPRKDDYIKLVIRSIIFSAVVYGCIYFDVRFLVAPPLLVAFTELSNPECKATKRILSVIAIVTLCAFTGAILRLFLVERLGMSYAITAFFVTIIVIIWVKLFKLYFPPSGAMAILALIIPANALIWYPLQVFCGICLWAGCSILIRKYQILQIKTGNSAL